MNVKDDAAYLGLVQDLGPDRFEGHGVSDLTRSDNGLVFCRDQPSGCGRNAHQLEQFLGLSRLEPSLTPG